MSISKRTFLKLTTASLAVLAGAGTPAFAKEGVIDVFFNSSSNVVEFWAAHVKPGFEAANPGVTLNLVPGGGGASMNALAERAYAALSTGDDPQVDLMEAIGPYHPKGAIEDGLWVDWTAAGIEGFENINPVVMQNEWSLPYRGSQVVMMFNADKVGTAPATFEELVAWIKANPGEFAYARPDVGDSGAVFIERAMQELVDQDPTKFTDTNYTDEYAAPIFAKLWDLLNEIEPYLYKEGEYTAGNTPSIQLLASGAISMTVAWSDMALTAINEGVVPPSTGLAQLQDLPFTGGFSSVLVPTNAGNKDLVMTLSEYLISAEVQNKVVTELGGFPGIMWDAMDPELAAKYSATAPTSIPAFPGGTWEPPLFDGWYRNVAS